MSVIEDTRKALDAASDAYNRLLARTRRVRVTTPIGAEIEIPAAPERPQADADGPSKGAPDSGTPAP